MKRILWIFVFLFSALLADKMENYDGKIEKNLNRQLLLLNDNWQYLEDNCQTVDDLENLKSPGRISVCRTHGTR